MFSDEMYERAAPLLRRLIENNRERDERDRDEDAA